MKKKQIIYSRMQAARLRKLDLLPNPLACFLSPCAFVAMRWPDS